MKCVLFSGAWLLRILLVSDSLKLIELNALLLRKMGLHSVKYCCCCVIAFSMLSIFLVLLVAILVHHFSIIGNSSSLFIFSKLNTKYICVSHCITKRVLFCLSMSRSIKFEHRVFLYTTRMKKLISVVKRIISSQWWKILWVGSAED